MDTLKNFMTTMKDTILQQVTEQVKKTMDVVSSMRPMPAFNYVPTEGCEPSYRRTPVDSLHRSDESLSPVDMQRALPVLHGRTICEGCTESRGLLRGQEVNPTGVTQIPLRFGDKSKTWNLEVDFLVVDVPTAYNVILGRLTLHRLKVVIVSYLLQLQYEANDDNARKLQGD
ncbi:hypothetical protein Cgig2_013033 [Carnegiea gigantea]|uniref:Uncharacterized protein n=1 Tax=Carnegiea gigantea TaxID=171969 RepID=A0A9Q1GVF4_9CARY|nr:hypothetical protein Cgig2_013033 [Carnegiea gigantea]